MRILILLAASLAIAAPAAATIYTVTYAGTISNAYQSGASGPATGFQNGQSFVTRYTVDTSKGFRLSGSTYDEVYGGPSGGVEIPILTFFSVNGISQASFKTSVSADAYLDKGDLSLQSTAILSDNGTSETLFQVQNISELSPLYLNLDTQPTGFTAPASSGSYQYYVYNYLTSNYDSLAQGELIVSSVTIRAGDAVPEPATWALMITGFGLVGITARRHRTAVTA